MLKLILRGVSAKRSVLAHADLFFFFPANFYYSQLRQPESLNMIAGRLIGILSNQFSKCNTSKKMK